MTEATADRINYLQADIEHMEMLKALAASEGATSEELYYEHDLYIKDATEELMELGVTGLSIK